MAIKMVALKCPECGADLEVPEGPRKIMYCAYCGAKIILQDDNEYTVNIHTTDDADVERAKTDQMVKEHQIELSKMREANRGRKLRLKIKYTIILALIGSALLILGFIAGDASGDSDSSLYMLSILGEFTLFSIVFVWTHEDKDDEPIDFSDRAKIPNGVSDFESKDYRTIEAILKGAGFKDVQCIPLNDLTTGWIKRPGKVASITVNGEEIHSVGSKYPRDSAIMIMYHSYVNR